LVLPIKDTPKENLDMKLKSLPKESGLTLKTAIESPSHEPTARHKRPFTIKSGLKVGQGSYEGCGCSPYDYSEGYNTGYQNALDNITNYLSQLDATF
jgi:hypothetical protein